ncbi:MAG: TlyA family RNA methyltransferase, partial [Alphaproteobacteria bacterium]
RTRTAAWVREGAVSVDGVVADDPAKKYAANAQVKIRHTETQWVSRGAHKLLGALELFPIEVAGKTCLDLGSSTGGFTEVLLRNGAAKVYAVDVGHDQLAPSLKANPAVVSMEGTNARHLTKQLVPDGIDLLVSDVSFISLRLALPAGIDLLAPDGQLVVLIKPQFEVGKGNLGKNGVVKDPLLHEQVCEDIRSFMVETGLEVGGISTSPILGPKGNKEFLIHAKKKA